MKKGFLLSPRSPESTTKVLQGIAADECPVCLDALEPSLSILWPCRHFVCESCTKVLWTMRRSQQRATIHLECPLCRELALVSNGDISAFVAAHAAANFGGTPSTPRKAGGMSKDGLDTLTVRELKIVVRELSLQQRIVGMIERSDIERAVLQHLEVRVYARVYVSTESALRDIHVFCAASHAFIVYSYYVPGSHTHACCAESLGRRHALLAPLAAAHAMPTRHPGQPARAAQ